MPLLSIEFLLFFLLFFPLYWGLKKYPAEQNALLLLCSLGWLYYLAPLFAFNVILFSLIIALFAYGLFRFDNPKTRKTLLFSGIIATLAQLGFFKFNDFFLPTLKSISEEPLLDILLPLGISYYTFQSIAYLIAVYKREYIPLKWHNLLLHFSFFLTVTAGPIARTGDFKNGKNEHYAGMYAQLQNVKMREIITPHIALALIIMGLAKKWWLAAWFADIWVSDVFDNPAQYNLTEIFQAIYGYTFQLYFDFSGYSDLVVGLGLLLGFQLPRNFNMPLLAKNLREFWAKWHISLSSWIRDYIYIPLGGNRQSFLSTQANIIIAMSLSGIWHGYGFHFLLWGLLHGLGIVFLNLLDKFGKGRKLSKIPFIGRGLAVVSTLSFVSFAFILFNHSLDDLPALFAALWQNSQGWQLPSFSALGVLILLALWLSSYTYLNRFYHWAITRISQLPMLLWCVPLVLILGIIMLLSPSGIPGFIYANF